MTYELTNTTDLGVVQKALGVGRRSKRIVLIGDSFGDTYGYAITAGGSPATYANITSNTRRSSSFMSWFQYLSGQQFDYNYPQMQAVGGQTSTAAMAYAATALDASNAGIAIWQVGTNDWQLTNGAADTIANDKAFIALCRARGMRCVLMGIAPRNGWADSPDTPTSLKRWRWISHVNRWRQEAARMYPDVYFADTNAVWADPSQTSGQCFANRHRGDGLHPSDGTGAYYLGLALWRAFQDMGYVYQPEIRNGNLAGAYNITDNPYGNRFDNGALQGAAAAAGTGMSGTNPTNFVLARNSGTTGTAVGSQVTRSEGTDFGNCQQYVFSIPSTGSVNEQFRADVTTTSFVVGELLFSQIGYEVISAVGFRCPSILLSCLDAGSATLASATIAESTGTWPNGNSIGVLRTDPILVPANTATVRLRFFQTIDGGSTSNGGTIKLTDAFIGRAPSSFDVGF